MNYCQILKFTNICITTSNIALRQFWFNRTLPREVSMLFPKNIHLILWPLPLEQLGWYMTVMTGTLQWATFTHIYNWQVFTLQNKQLANIALYICYLHEYFHIRLGCCFSYRTEMQLFINDLQSVFHIQLTLVFNRPGRSQGLLYKHRCAWFVNLTILPLTLRQRHAQAVRDRSSSYKIWYVAQA